MIIVITWIIIIMKQKLQIIVNTNQQRTSYNDSKNITHSRPFLFVRHSVIDQELSGVNHVTRTVRHLFLSTTDSAVWCHSGSPWCYFYYLFSVSHILSVSWLINVFLFIVWWMAHVTYTYSNTSSITAISYRYYFTNLRKLIDSPLYKSYVRHFYYSPESSTFFENSFKSF